MGVEGIQNFTLNTPAPATVTASKPAPKAVDSASSASANASGLTVTAPRAENLSASVAFATTPNLVSRSGEQNDAQAKTVNGNLQADRGQGVSAKDAAMQEAKRLQEKREEEERYNSIMTQNAVKNANNRVKATHTDAKFEYDDKIGQITITIEDTDTNKVVKEIPSEEMKDVLERIHTMKGLLMDTEV